MSKKSFISALAILFTISFGMSAAFFLVPQRASAADSGSGCIVGLAAGLASVVTNGVVSVPSADAAGGAAGWTSAGSNVGSCLYNLIVVPVLRQMIRSMLQQMTNATINWINGSNGTGQPSYVQNLAVHLQAVGDVAALSFIAQTAKAFNSPFGSAISASLQTQYSQKTSLGGFYAANQCTLSKSSPNINSYLAGNWSQGGVATWFALTTQSQNNPYMLYQAAQSQLGNSVSQVQVNRRQDLIQGNGFLSYCGGDTSLSSVSANVSGGVAVSSSGVKLAAGINPQISCTNPDGTPAKATTPGSTISSYLQANVNSGIGQLVSAQDLDAAIGQVVSALGNKVLGSTGLFGSSQPSSSNNTTPVIAAPSITSMIGTGNSAASQAVSSLGSAALDGAGVASAASSGAALAQTTLSQITLYTNAWNTVTAAANLASTTIVALPAACPATASETTAVQIALTTEIAPVLAQAQMALNSNSISATKAFALQVQAEATAVPATDPNQLDADIITLTSMPPTPADVSDAQSKARTTPSTIASHGGGATASPVGSLTVSGGTLVDQMNLISTNAAALQIQLCMVYNNNG